MNFCDIMSVFEKAVTEVKQGQESFCTNNSNASPERDITYFNRTLVILNVTSFVSINLINL